MAEVGQKDYGAVMAESSAIRADKVQEVGKLQNTKPSITACLTQLKEELASAVASAAEAATVISSLHKSCEWLLRDFDARKTARAGEVEVLNNTEAVLAGADFCFQLLQCVCANSLECPILQ